MGRPIGLKTAVRRDRITSLRAQRDVAASAIESAVAGKQWSAVSPLLGRLASIESELADLMDEKAKAEAERVPDEPFDPGDV